MTKFYICRIVEVLVKFDGNSVKDYQLIGTCEAKAPAGRLGNKNANNALNQLEKCACENGGDLVKILDSSSRSGATLGSYFFTGASAALNPNAPRKVNKDKIYAEIYIKKQ